MQSGNRTCPWPFTYQIFIEQLLYVSGTVLQSLYVRVKMTGETIVTEQRAASEKRESFIFRSTGKETGGRAQICLSDLGCSQTFMSWGRMGWYLEVLANTRQRTQKTSLGASHGFTIIHQEEQGDKVLIFTIRTISQAVSERLTLQRRSSPSKILKGVPDFCLWKYYGLKYYGLI